MSGYVATPLTNGRRKLESAKRTAVHEAGHAIAAREVGCHSIVASARANHHPVLGYEISGAVRHSEVPRYVSGSERISRQLVVVLAGPVAADWIGESRDILAQTPLLKAAATLLKLERPPQARSDESWAASAWQWGSKRFVTSTAAVRRT